MVTRGPSCSLSAPRKRSVSRLGTGRAKANSFLRLGGRPGSGLGVLLERRGPGPSCGEGALLLSKLA